MLGRPRPRRSVLSVRGLMRSRPLLLTVILALVVGVVQALSFAAAPHASRAFASASSGTGGQFVSAQGRILDTRSGSQVGPYNSPMPAGAWRKVQVDGLAGIPTSAVSAVTVTFTVVNPSGDGLINADKDEATPNSIVNYLNYQAAGGIQSNTATLAVADDGKIQVRATNNSTDLIMDVEGYYTSDSTVAPGGYVPVTPSRLVDTRNGTDLPQAKLSGGSTTTIPVAGHAGIPAGATGAMLNFTIVNNTSTGDRYFTPYPADDTSPPTTTLTLHFDNGIMDANAAQVGLATTGVNAGAIKFFLTGSGYTVDLTVDVVGYFAAGTSTGAFTPAQARVYDSRITGHTTVAAGATAKVQVAGVGGLPLAGSGISSVVTDLTAVNANSTVGNGYLTMWADGTPLPTPFSSMHYEPSAITSNMVTSALGANGAVDVYNGGSVAVNFVIDVEGWYTNTGGAISNGQTQTQQSVTLQGSAIGGGPWVTYQYRTGTVGAFVKVPTANVKDGNGTSPSAWPVTTSSGTFTAYTWNIRNTLAALAANNGVAPDGLVQVEACYGVSSTDSNPVCGMPNNVDFAQDSSQGSTDIGPGSVSELTGDFSLDATDANAASSLGFLSVGRSLDTLNPSAASTTAAGVFGPGWTADLSGPDAGSADLTPVDDSAQGFILLTDTDGTETTYTQDPTNTQRFLGEGTDADDTSIVTRPSSTSITLTDADGTVTTWTKNSNGAWQATSVKQPGSNSTTSYTYNSSGLVTRILAPVASGVVDAVGNAGCGTYPDSTAGCRSLLLKYASVGSPSVTRLSEIDLSIPQSTSTQTDPNSIKAVENYDYDSSGRLAHAWDPRISPALKTAYTYTTANRLATLTPAGLATWSFTYDSGNRLSTVSRPDPSGSTAVTTIVYALSQATSGTNAGPVNLSAATTATWGETADLPVTGTAIFQADHVPAGTTVGSVSSSDWPYASIDYLDVNGNTVNSASYGAGAWQVGTTQYDPSTGNELWSLTAGNRAQALKPTSDTDPYVASLSSGSTIDSVDAAALLRSDTAYDPLTGNVTDTYGPTHPVTLSSGTVIDARTHVATSYDQNAPITTVDPNTGTPVNPASLQPYGLPTTVTTTAYDVRAKTDTSWPDIQVTRTGYDPIVSGDTSGWTLGSATSSTVQVGASASAANDLVTRTRYDANGRTTEQRLPNDANGSTRRTTLTSYYTASGSGSCVDATRVGLVCSTAPAAQPSTGSPLAVVTYTYNQYGDATAKIETYGTGSSQVVRTTSTGYDAAERKTSSSVAVTPASAGGTAVPAVAYGYDSSTGLPTTKTTGSGASAITLTTAYNNLGETTTYTDAAGTVSTKSYDLDGRVTSSNDGKGTTTYSYDGGGEHRGVVTGEDIGVTGSPSSFAASYDTAGNMASETYPNGLVATRHYDNASNLTALTYAKSGSTWMSFTQSANAIGQITKQSSPQSSQVFTYDPADRLTSTQDTYNGSCTTRVYIFDAHSNRTSLASYPGSGTGNATCSTNTTPVTTSYTYDDADRLTSDTAGSYTYDTLGRTLNISSGDAQGIGAHASTTGGATISYNADDMVATEQQDSTTDTFTLDPDQNRINTQTEGATMTTNHYGDDSDSPTSTSTDSSTWTRNITGIDGGLAATADQTGTITLQLTNPHGDTIATCADFANATVIASYSESTEYGQPRNAATANTTYGWLGSKQRSSNDLAGVTLMGVRLYNPTTGRFLSTDPVSGGSAGPYLYPTNPISDFDLNGQWWGSHWVHKHWRRYTHFAARVTSSLSTFAGFAPAWICEWCAGASLALGYASSGLYYASGDHAAARRQFEVTGVSAVLGRFGAARFGRHATRAARWGARAVSYGRSSIASYGYNVHRCGITPWCG